MMWSWLTHDNGQFMAVQIPMSELLSIEGNAYLANSGKHDPLIGTKKLGDIIRPITLWRIERHQC